LLVIGHGDHLKQEEHYSKTPHLTKTLYDDYP
jgi:hypothetical protein